MNRGRSRDRSAAAAVLATVGFTGACADANGSSGWTASVDTLAGMVQVINTPPETSVGSTLVGQEELRIGALEGGGPDSFGMIRSIAVLEDGRFAVADGQAQEIRLFDREGRHLRTFGGEGEGPGELGNMQGVHVDHEGLLRVAEVDNARLSVFHPDSGFVRSFPFHLNSYWFRGPWRASVDSAGRTFVMSSGRFGEDRFWSMVRVYDPEMTQLDSMPYYDYTDDVERQDYPGAWRISLGGTAYSYMPIPFYAQGLEVLTQTGEFWTHAAGEPQLRLVRWTPAGDTSLVAVSRRQPDPVTAAERDSAMAATREELAERLSGSPPALDASDLPSTKPPAYALSLDDHGRVWVRLSEPAADTTAYDVFGGDGLFAETVSLPFRVDEYIPPVVRDDMLWAVITDDLDVQYVVRARLRPPDDSAPPLAGVAERP